MKLFELRCKAYIKKNIKFFESFEAIAKYINFALVAGELEEVHKKVGFKHYCFSGFRLFESEKPPKMYKAGETREFTLRSFDEKIIDTHTQTLRENVNNPQMLVIETAKKSINQHFISELYTATPTIVICKDKKYWTLQESGDIMQLHKQLQDNLEKKYQSFFGEALHVKQNFIQLLELKNRVPQNIRIHKNNKEIKFFGNKFKIIPNEDEMSQKLAFTALACGLGEKNSYGGGFCLGKGIR